MQLGRRGLQGVKDFSEEQALERAIRDQCSGMQKIASDISFTFLKIVGSKELRQFKVFTLVRSVREETVWVEFVSNYFISNTLRLCC